MSLLTPSAASRLCSACGICCNGVMFYKVRLQSGDVPRELRALGLKIKHKHTEQFSLQPCPAFQGAQCGIYAQRPERCELFTCRQLKRVALGEIGEDDALEKIHEVVRLVAEVNRLLDESGKTDPTRPLGKSYEKITATPVDPADPQAVELREQLTFAMQELEAMIDRDFRP